MLDKPSGSLPAELEIEQSYVRLDAPLSMNNGAWSVRIVNNEMLGVIALFVVALALIWLLARQMDRSRA